MILLLDTLVKRAETTLTEHRIEIDGTIFTGYMMAKPLNYSKKYTTLFDRFRMLKAIMRGKAIAVCFFEDMTKEQQRVYAKSVIEREKKQNNKY